MDGNAGKVGAGGKAQQQQQNFDSRTLALLNRLASRRQSSGPASGARPDSAKADATPPGGKVAAGAAGRAGTALPVRDARVPIDLSGKTSGNQVRLQSRARARAAWLTWGLRTGAAASVGSAHPALAAAGASQHTAAPCMPARARQCPVHDNVAAAAAPLHCA